MLVGGAQVSPHITQSSMFTVNLDKGTIGAEVGAVPKLYWSLREALLIVFCHK